MGCMHVSESRLLKTPITFIVVFMTVIFAGVDLTTKQDVFLIWFSSCINDENGRGGTRRQ